MNIFILLLFILLGTVLASFFSLIPALHIYNVIGLFFLLSLSLTSVIPSQVLPYFFMAMIVTYSFINTLPALFLGAPDDSTLFVVLPGQKYMMENRGYEAAVLIGIGSLIGSLLLILLSPVYFKIFPKLIEILNPHMYWILSLLAVYIIMSEWPKGGDYGKNGWVKFFRAWRSLSAGIASFILSGFLGIIVLNKTLLPVKMSFQGIMPVFVGLFAVPWLITNLLSKTQIPKQHIAEDIDVTPALLIRGSATGYLGGIFAALFPVVTGGIGGLLAGHATGQRDERLFLISQGASKTIYYVGAFLLFFVPVLSVTRGGLAWIIAPLYRPQTMQDYLLAASAIIISSGMAFLLLLLLTKKMIFLVEHINYAVISYVTLGILIILIFALTGIMGLFIMSVASAIGLIPVLFHSRRMNLMGALLVPLIINMAGWGPKVLHFLGL